MIGVTRLSRRPPAGPGPLNWERYRADWLDRSDKLFPPTAVGNEASFREDFEMRDKLHGLQATKMRLEDIVIRTPEFYWVLDYRATVELFDKYYPDFQRFAKSAKL